MNKVTHLELDELSLVDDPAQEPALVAILKKRTFSAERREQLAASGAAMADGAYPIENAGDLRNAIGSWGRGGARPAVARHIASRARTLGLTKLLPTEGQLASVIGGKMDLDEAVKVLGDGQKATTDLMTKLVAKMDSMLEHLKPEQKAKKAKTAEPEWPEDGDAPKARKYVADVVAAAVTEAVTKAKTDSDAEMKKLQDRVEASEQAAKAIVRKAKATELAWYGGTEEDREGLADYLDSLEPEPREVIVKSLKAKVAVTAALQTRGVAGAGTIVEEIDQADVNPDAELAHQELTKMAKARQGEHADETFAQAYEIAGAARRDLLVRAQQPGNAPLDASAGA